jgi:hypothetical protein
MARFFDFDAAWAEQAAKDGAPDPVEVRVFGETWELFPKVPAAAILLVARMMNGGERELSDAEAVQYLAHLVPEAVYGAWLDRGMDVDKIRDIARVILPLYMAADPEADTSGGAKARKANGSSPRSSPTGRRSKRTSPATTAST